MSMLYFFKIVKISLAYWIIINYVFIRICATN
jgi:hypothetical protein